MSANSSKSDEIEFCLQRLSDEDGNVCIRVNIPVKQKDFNHDFYVHYRKKGEVQWQSSPLIRQSNLIDMHGLELDSIYEIRVALLSNSKQLSTYGICNQAILHQIQINQYDGSKCVEDNNHFSPNINTEIVEKYADQILNDVFQYLYYYINNVSNPDYSCNE